MKIETHPREDHQITLIIEVEPEKLEGARRKSARQIAEKVKIPGFRPGKAPYDVVRRIYGEKVITEEAMELLVEELYPLAIKEADIKPGAPGQIENIEGQDTDTPKFIFTVPLAPTVELGDYKAVRQPYEWVAPGEEKVEEEIQNLRRMYSKVEPVEREAQEGDFVTADVVGRKVAAAEDEAPLVERKDFTAIVHAEGRDNEWPFSGFSANFLGVKAEEKKEVVHQFADDHSDEALKGQEVKFEVAIKLVRGVNLVALDDDFAQKIGVGQTVADLRERIRENVEAESRAEYDDKYFEQVLEQVKAGATLKYPPQVLEHEMEHVLEDMERRLKSQGVENLDAYFKIVKTTKEKFMEEQARPTAQKRLERGLIMDEIARAEKVELDEKSLEVEFRNTWASLAMNDEEFSKQTKGGTKPTREIIDAVTMDSANRLLTRRTLETLKAIATGQAAAAAEAPAAEEKVDEPVAEAEQAGDPAADEPKAE